MKSFHNLSEYKIIVTGGAGFLGKNVVRKFGEEGVPSENIFVPRSKDYDLRRESAVERMLNDFPADILVNLAAKVGGIGYNMENPGVLFYDSIIMGVNLIEQARLHDVKKFVAVGTVCSYPKYCTVPFKEDDIWNGYPEETNAPYGLAKKALLVQLQAYRKQYGFNGIYLIPVNLYGPGDNFKPESSHVIPALIKKFDDAVTERKDSVSIWGTGNASREFLYVDDAAEGIVKATKLYKKEDPVNLGSGMEISIRELTTLIAQETGFEGEVSWEKTKPDGQPRRCLDVSRAIEEFDFKAKTPFEEGLKKTIEWYRANKDSIY
ncbi:MAG: GDP-L-fucose synthase [Nanoarchaeota archaeon]|nr:GDP-L-fucose synthase [Nanoarchaeota archaeon]